MNTFTKKDLKNGDIVVTRGGELGGVLTDSEIILYQHNGFDSFDMFSEDLLDADDRRDCDIMRVYRNSAGAGLGFLDYNGEDPIFERE